MLDAEVMKATFRAKMTAAFEDEGFDPDDPNFNKYATAICETIIEHFVANAVINISYKDGQGQPSVDVTRTTTGVLT